MRILAVFVALVLAGAAHAGQRYATPPPLTLSPDLEGAWTLQLKRPPAKRMGRTTSRRPARARVRVSTRRASRRNRAAVRRTIRRANATRRTLRARAPTPPAVRDANGFGTLRTAPGGGFDPALLPRIVRYDTHHKAGTVVVDTIERRLYLVMTDGRARRYGIGVGKPGFEWSGSHRVTRKKEWPGWTPPREMIEREALKGRILPAHMPGGPDNPLGARALYLGSTLYRIHGTNQNWSIGQAVSSGCIRMRNEDVMDLYDRVKVGAKVHVI